MELARFCTFLRVDGCDGRRTVKTTSAIVQDKYYTLSTKKACAMLGVLNRITLVVLSAEEALQSKSSDVKQICIGTRTSLP